MDRGRKDDRRSRTRSSSARAILEFLQCFPFARPASVMQKTRSVRGAITSKDVLFHAFTIVRLFGPTFYLRCVKAIASGRTCTFLEVLAERQ
jgi:hypothetical protein